MKENTKFALLILVIMCLWIVLLPIVIIAEEVTLPYYDTSPIVVALGTGGYAGNTLFVNASDFRVVFSDQSTQYQYAIISPDLNAKYSLRSNGLNGNATPPTESEWANISTITRTYVKDGVTYRIGYWTLTKSHQNVQIEYATNQSFRNNDELIWELTYGYDGPVSSINWGLLRDVNYSTRIAGNGSAAIRNVDYLTWDTAADANGNGISECQVEIRCVPGDFFGSTESDLLNKTYQDFNLGNYSSFSLGTLDASSGTFSVSWSYILNHLGWNVNSLYKHLENELWLKNGWYYQIRLLGSDGYEGQWQTMYTPLSQSSKASETVINQNSFDMSIYQVYQELTTINNNTSITINIEDTDYTVTNPDDGDEPQEGTDLWDILKQMLNGIFQIVKNIAALPGKLFDMIQSLFIMPDTYNFGDQLDTEINSYMQENQPGLLAIQEGTADIRDTLEDTAPAGSGQYPQCIFTWDAVQLDLSPFNAGTVTFFAAGSFDFTAAFIQMIEGFGMTYSDYQFYVSAVIYLWLVVFIYRHVNTFLKGGGETKSG